MKAHGSTVGLLWKLSGPSAGGAGEILVVAVKGEVIRGNTGGEGGLLDLN